jgi:guanine deaminase
LKCNLCRIIVGRMSEQDKIFMRRAIELAATTSLVESAGGAFGAVVVRDGEIIAEGANRVVAENDPTWHAEMAAIRQASAKLRSFKLHGCVLYTSAEPCPMCAAACYWAGIERMFYASTVEDALEYGGFDDSLIYQELKKPLRERSIPSQQILREEAIEIWKKYRAKADKVPY